MLQLLHKDYSVSFTRVFQPLSISFNRILILRELGRCGEIKNTRASKLYQRGFEPSIQSPAFYSCATILQSYLLPHITNNA